MVGLREIAGDVYVLRQPVLDVNATLVVGGELALVVDTLTTDAQAAELLAGVRRVTHLPLVIVNTHHHYDHCLGNATLAAASPRTTIWAHQAAVITLRDPGAELQQAAADELAGADPALAQAIATSRLLPPDRIILEESIMDLGGRRVELRH